MYCTKACLYADSGGRAHTHCRRVLTRMPYDPRHLRVRVKKKFLIRLAIRSSFGNVAFSRITSLASYDNGWETWLCEIQSRLCKYLIVEECTWITWVPPGVNVLGAVAKIILNVPVISVSHGSAKIYYRNLPLCMSNYFYTDIAQGNLFAPFCGDVY